jgi:hypothetical protein
MLADLTRSYNSNLALPNHLDGKLAVARRLRPDWERAACQATGRFVKLSKQRSGKQAKERREHP